MPVATNPSNMKIDKIDPPRSISDILDIKKSWLIG